MSAVAGLPAATSAASAAVRLVAGGADRQRIVAGLELGGREAVMALVVAHHRDGEARAGLAGADQHALHGAFLLRGDLASERGAGLRVRAQAVARNAIPIVKIAVVASHLPCMRIEFLLGSVSGFQNLEGRNSSGLRDLLCQALTARISRLGGCAGLFLALSRSRRGGPVAALFGRGRPTRVRRKSPVPGAASNIQFLGAGEFRALLDEVEARLGLGAHQPLDRVGGLAAVVGHQRDPQQRALPAGPWWFP